MSTSSHPAPGSGLLPWAVVALILLGVFFRLYHADRKVLSDDEAVTMMHSLGISEAGVMDRASGFHHASDLQSVLHPAAAPRGAAATIETLRLEDPQHPPAFYLGAAAWMEFFGNSRLALRLYAAAIGILALPCMFWLCLELFGASGPAWAATALLAISPVNVLYAQEAREYGLWLVGLLLASALFIRALRTGSPLAWLCYALALAFALYCYPASAFVALAHAGTATFANTSWANRLRAYAAIAGGMVLFGPWLLVIVRNIAQINQGMALINHARSTPMGVLRSFVALVRLEALDLNGAMKLLAVAVTVPCAALVVYSILHLRRAAGATALFVGMLIACTTLPLIVPDLLWGGQRTATPRYFIPFFAAMDIALAALLHGCFAAARPRIRLAPVVSAALLLLVAGRIGSLVQSSAAQTWWTQYNMRSIELAAIIDAAPRPLLISDNYVVWSLALGEYLDPAVEVAIAPRCYLCSRPPAGPLDLRALAEGDGVGSVFLLGPSERLQREVSALEERSKAPHRAVCIDIVGNCRDGVSLWSG